MADEATTADRALDTGLTSAGASVLGRRSFGGRNAPLEAEAKRAFSREGAMGEEQGVTVEEEEMAGKFVPRKGSGSGGKRGREGAGFSSGGGGKRGRPQQQRR